MECYLYKVKKNGVISKGIKNGLIGDIRKYFIDEGYVILDLKLRKQPKFEKPKLFKRVDFGILKKLFKFKHAVSNKKVSELCSQMSVLLDAGLTIPEALRLLIKSEKNKNFKIVLQNIEADINQGMSLSMSMKNQKQRFPNILVTGLKSIEASGNISFLFKDMAKYFEKIDETRNKIIGASIYPLILMSFLFIDLIVLSIKVVPMFKEAFSGAETKLPFITNMVFLVADIIRNYYLLIIAIVVSVPFVVILGERHEKIKRLLDKTILRIPILNNLIIDNSINVFLKSFVLLLKSGMTIMQSLESSLEVIGNHVVRENIQKDTKDIASGKPFYELIENNKYIRDIAKTLIETGENTAKLDITVDKAIYYYNTEIDKKIERINRLMEPVLIIIFGIIIGIVVMAIALPMFKISSGALVE